MHRMENKLWKFQTELYLLCNTKFLKLLIIYKIIKIQNKLKSCEFNVSLMKKNSNFFKYTLRKRLGMNKKRFSD